MTKQQLQEALVAETRRADHNWTEVGNFKAEVTGIKDPSILPNERVKILDAIVSTWWEMGEAQPLFTPRCYVNKQWPHSGPKNGVYHGDPGQQQFRNPQCCHRR